jgi:hypothetical protein
MPTRELCTTTRRFNMVLISCIPLPLPLPPSSVSVAELLSLDSWYFGLYPVLGVSSSLPSTLFCFLSLPCSVMVLCLCLPMCVSPTVSLAQSARDDLSVIYCKILESSPSVTNLLGMGVSLWVSSSSSNGSSLDRPCSIQSQIRFCAS